MLTDVGKPVDDKDTNSEMEEVSGKNSKGKEGQEEEAKAEEDGTGMRMGTWPGSEIKMMIWKLGDKSCKMPSITIMTMRVMRATSLLRKTLTSVVLGLA